MSRTTRERLDANRSRSQQLHLVAGGHPQIEADRKPIRAVFQKPLLDANRDVPEAGSGRPRREQAAIANLAVDGTEKMCQRINGAEPADGGVRYDRDTGRHDRHGD